MFMKFDVRVIDKKLSSKHEFWDIRLGDSPTLLKTVNLYSHSACFLAN